MNFRQSKTLRVRSDQNLELVKNQPCKVCGKRPVDPHHIRSRGAGGGDELENLLPLCRQHHVEWHTIGGKSMTKKYDLPITWEIYPRRSDL